MHSQGHVGARVPRTKKKKKKGRSQVRAKLSGPAARQVSSQLTAPNPPACALPGCCADCRRSRGKQGMSPPPPGEDA
eukprot:4727744-Prymnesium_polylepis.2